MSGEAMVRNNSGVMFCFFENRMDYLREKIMKDKIHPEYTEATITCICGNVLNTRSTVKSMKVNTCSSCHPFYTGTAKYMDTAGRVEQFQKRYGKK